MSLQINVTVEKALTKSDRAFLTKLAQSGYPVTVICHYAVPVTNAQKGSSEGPA